MLLVQTVMVCVLQVEMKLWAPKFRARPGDVLAPAGAFPYVHFQSPLSLSSP